MIDLAQPHALQYLLVIPLLIVAAIYYIRWHKKAVAQLGDTQLVNNLLVGGTSKAVQWKSIRWIVAITLIILALLGFRKSEHTLGTSTSTRQIVFCVDLSASMNTTDMPPSRLERAKNIVIKCLDAMPNNLYGLVYFAGNAFTDIALTPDAEAIKMSISAANTPIMSEQGTDIAAAIQGAAATINKSSNGGKAIIIITDGEDHEGGIASEINKCKQQGINVYAVGVGTTQGSTFIDPTTGMQKTDIEGQAVVSKLNEDVLAEIAKEAETEYYIATGNTVEQLATQINDLSAGTTSRVKQQTYTQYFQWLLLPAVLLLMLDYLIPIIKQFRKR